MKVHLLIKIAVAAFIICLASGSAISQFDQMRDPGKDRPEFEFRIARVKYRTSGGAGSRGFIQPWWAIDYPLAEEHFLPALRRVTNISVADDERHLELSDDQIFQYPFLFLQQPGSGNWRPTAKEAANLREHLLRGGFLLVDDFHGEYDWEVFEAAIRRVMPDRPIVEIPDDDPLMHIFYDLDKNSPIPGKRHLAYYRGEVVARMQGRPEFRGIYDDHNRLMV